MTTTNTKKYVAAISGIVAAVLAVVFAIALTAPSTALAANSKQIYTDQATDDTDPSTPVTLKVSYTKKYPECKLLVKVWPRTADEIAPEDIYPDDEAYPNTEPGHLACNGYWPADSDISYLGNGERIIANFRVYPAHMDNYRHTEIPNRYFEHFENVIVTFYCDVKYAYHSCRVYIEHEYEEDGSGSKKTQYLDSYVNSEGEIRLLIDKTGEVHDAGIVRVYGLTYFTVVINEEQDIDPNIDADISPYSPQTGSNTTVMVMGAMLIASVVAFAITLKRKRQTKDCQ